MMKNYEEEKMKIKEKKAQAEQNLKEAVDALKAKTVDCKVLQEVRKKSEQMMTKT